ncbi:MAG TPA: alpha/beta hydrolase [Acidimicrobiales bacterium]|nr:alpha/beta hydrolase [Acidimicrobiales bacterium]
MTSATTTEAVQGYLDLDGVRTYYEAIGAGSPLVLLHGGMCPVETWAGLVPQLSGSFRVFTPERRGHGRTADPGPITYENMATDTIAFLEAIADGPVALVGWSDGAVVALLVALWRPDLVERLVYVGNAINREGVPAEVEAMAEHLSPDVLPPMLRQLHDAVSPDGPDHFDLVFEKLAHLWKTEPNLELSELASLSMPTLLVAADHDMVTVEQLAAAQRTIPDAQLAIVPGSDHGFPMEHPDLLAGLLHRFLT